MAFPANNEAAESVSSLSKATWGFFIVAALSFGLALTMVATGEYPRLRIILLFQRRFFSGRCRHHAADPDHAQNLAVLADPRQLQGVSVNFAAVGVDQPLLKLPQLSAD